MNANGGTGRASTMPAPRFRCWCGDFTIGEVGTGAAAAAARPFAAACQAGVALADEVAAAGFDQRVRLPDVDALMRAMVSEHRHLIGFIIAINTMTGIRVG